MNKNDRVKPVLVGGADEGTTDRRTGERAASVPKPHRGRCPSAFPVASGPVRALRGSGILALTLVAEQATITPSTDKGNRTARRSGSPWRGASSYMCG